MYKKTDFGINPTKGNTWNIFVLFKFIRGPQAVGDIPYLPPPCGHSRFMNILVVRSNSANAWRASKYMSIGKDDLWRKSLWLGMKS